MKHEIILRYFPLVTRYARFIIKDSIAAEEIGSKVMEDLYEFPSVWQNETELRSYLKNTTHSVCNRWLYDNILEIRKKHSSADVKN